MFNTHICKNCFQSYSGKPEVCPHCGVQLNSKNKKTSKKEDDSAQADANNGANTEPNFSDVEKVYVASPEKQKKQKKKHKKHVSSKQIMDGINFEELILRTNDSSVNKWREKRKRKNQPQFSVQKDGEFDIDVRDVTYLPSTYTYSAKKARGEQPKEKIKWWEIYKWADLMLARRKIKKQVKRASSYKPKEIKSWVMITLCILFGWFGIHNFYARNHRKGWFAAICFTLGCVILFNFYSQLQLTAGLLLFIPVCMWVLDLVALIFGTYSYRLSKWKFIDCLNADTRVKLGYKYLDKDEYKKPWIVRMVRKIYFACKQNSQKRKAKNAAASNSTNTESAVDAESLDNNNAEPLQEQPVAKTTTASQKTTNKNKNSKKARIVVKKSKK